MAASAFGTSRTTYLIIDGGNFWRTVNALSGSFLGVERPELDWGRVRGPHRRAYYYDAVPVQGAAEDSNDYAARIDPKMKELAALERQPGWHIRAGDVRHRRRRGNEQKMVDVQLAVDALLMASRGLFSGITLMTGDLDFKPLVTALVEMGIDVNLLYPTGATNDELIAAADTATALTIRELSEWLDLEAYGVKLPSVSAEPDVPIDRIAAVSEWQELAFGRCILAQDRQGRWVVMTETFPGAQYRYGLKIWSEDASMLRRYVANVYDLTIPE